MSLGGARARAQIGGLPYRRTPCRIGVLRSRRMEVGPGRPAGPSQRPRLYALRPVTFYWRSTSQAWYPVRARACALGDHQRDCGVDGWIGMNEAHAGPPSTHGHLRTPSTSLPLHRRPSRIVASSRVAIAKVMRSCSLELTLPSFLFA